MEFIPHQRQENRPFIQLLYMGIGAIGGLVLSIIIGFVIVMAIYGLEVIKDTSWINGSSPELVGALKILLTAQQLGLFLFPALLLGIIERKRPAQFYGLHRPRLSILLWVFFIMLAMLPGISGINELNQKMTLPGFLKEVEVWMRQMEDEAAKTTEALLTMKSIGSFLITLFVVAIVPAICEEFLFRGALQRTLLRWIKNPHIGIWLSAVIFSAIHFQFFGFFPRLFLGAAFGYIYFWTGSLWYTVFAHFLNNGFAVATAWYFQLKGQSSQAAGEAQMPVQWYGYLISILITVVLFKQLKDRAAA